jgi:hypothetical protein
MNTDQRYDQRTISRRMQRGQVEMADYQKYLAELPDLTGSSEFVDYDRMFREELAAQAAQAAQAALAAQVVHEPPKPVVPAYASPTSAPRPPVYAPSRDMHHSPAPTLTVPLAPVTVSVASTVAPPRPSASALPSTLGAPSGGAGPRAPIGNAPWSPRPVADPKPAESSPAAVVASAATVVNAPPAAAPNPVSSLPPPAAPKVAPTESEPAPLPRDTTENG